jgi:hypothetical protein
MGDLGPLGDGTSVDYGQEILADAELSLDDLLAAGNCCKQVLPLPLPPIVPNVVDDVLPERSLARVHPPAPLRGFGSSESRGQRLVQKDAGEDAL